MQLLWCCLYRVKNRSRAELEYDADVSRANVLLKSIVFLLSIAAVVAVVTSPVGAPAAVVTSGGMATGSCCDLGFECLRLSSLREEISSRGEDPTAPVESEFDCSCGSDGPSGSCSCHAEEVEATRRDPSQTSAP